MLNSNSDCGPNSGKRTREQEHDCQRRLAHPYFWGRKEKRSSDYSIGWWIRYHNEIKLTFHKCWATLPKGITITRRFFSQPFCALPCNCLALRETPSSSTPSPRKDVFKPTTIALSIIWRSLICLSFWNIRSILCVTAFHRSHRFRLQSYASCSV